MVSAPAALGAPPQGTLVILNLPLAIPPNLLADDLGPVVANMWFLVANMWLLAGCSEPVAALGAGEAALQMPESGQFCPPCRCRATFQRCQPGMVDFSLGI